MILLSSVHSTTRAQHCKLCTEMHWTDSMFIWTSSCHYLSTKCKNESTVKYACRNTLTFDQANQLKSQIHRNWQASIVRSSEGWPLSRLVPSATLPTRFRLAAVKSGWRANSSWCTVKNSADGGANIFQQQRGSSRRHSVNKLNANYVLQ